MPRGPAVGRRFNVHEIRSVYLGIFDLPGGSAAALSRGRCSPGSAAPRAIDARRLRGIPARAGAADSHRGSSLRQPSWRGADVELGGTATPGTPPACRRGLRSPLLEATASSARGRAGRNKLCTGSTSTARSSGAYIQRQVRARCGSFPRRNAPIPGPRGFPANRGRRPNRGQRVGEPRASQRGAPRAGRIFCVHGDTRRAAHGVAPPPRPPSRPPPRPPPASLAAAAPPSPSPSTRARFASGLAWWSLETGEVRLRVAARRAQAASARAPARQRGGPAGRGAETAQGGERESRLYTQPNTCARTRTPKPET